MKLSGLCLLATILCVVQAEVVDSDEYQTWIKRRSPVDDSTNGASCIKETVTETLQHTITVSAGGVGGGQDAPSTVTVIMPAATVEAEAEESGSTSAGKFEGTVAATAEDEAVVMSQSTSTVTKLLTVVARAPAASTVTQMLTATVTLPASTITQTVTVVKTAIQGAPDAPPKSAPAPGMPNGIGVGVSTVPIPSSALPTTTFKFDPLASNSKAPAPLIPPPSSINTPAVSSAAPIKSTAAQSSGPVASPVEPPSKSVVTSALKDVSTKIESTAQGSPTTAETPRKFSDTSVVADSSTKPATSSVAASSTTSAAESVVASRTSIKGTTAAAASTSAATSLNLGGLSPDTTALIESAVLPRPKQTAVATAGGVPLILSEINISTLTFNSIIDLGNLIEATPKVKVQAQATKGVSSMELDTLG